MPERRTIALIAHDQKKDDLAAFVSANEAVFAPFKIVATGTTGARISQHCPSLDVTAMKSGPLGGDQQIGAMIATGEVSCLIFFIDPLTAMPHDVDVKALTRLAVLYDIPMAQNRATADAILGTLND